VCLNQGGGRFATDGIPIPAESATSIVPADFDRDGPIVGDERAASLVVYVKDGTGRAFTPKSASAMARLSLRVRAGRHRPRRSDRRRARQVGRAAYVRQLGR